MKSGIPSVLAVSLAAGLCVLGGLVLWRTRASDPVEALLASMGARSDLPDGGRILSSDGTDGRRTTAEIGWGDERLRVRVRENIAAGDVQRAVDEEKALLEDLFEDHQAPYPGALSHTLTCPSTFRPVFETPSGEERLKVRLFANDRFAYGGCADDLLRYRSTFVLLYDAPGRRLLRLEYFSPRSSGTDRADAVLRGFQAP